ncbi:MAG: hypothetical protein D6694_13545 [Gammaproteobacteria bacterium]|nr:MAG: hypothetical protein D6694_13545 [Gammaproteobacteria bacterium]
MNLHHLTGRYPTNCFEMLNKGIMRRSNVVGIFPNKATVISLVDAVLLEQRGERQMSCPLSWRAWYGLSIRREARIC